MLPSIPQSLLVSPRHHTALPPSRSKKGVWSSAIWWPSFGETLEERDRVPSDWSAALNQRHFSQISTPYYLLLCIDGNTKVGTAICDPADVLVGGTQGFWNMRTEVSSCVEELTVNASEFDLWIQLFCWLAKCNQVLWSLLNKTAAEGLWRCRLETIILGHLYVA